MKNEIQPTSVRILDKEYLIACPESEKQGLLTSADYLNNRIREVQRGGKVVGIDRITVMAALNITHELLQANKLDQSESQSLQLIMRMQDKIDDALTRAQQMEF